MALIIGEVYLPVRKTATCWLWLGKKDREGYGQVRLARNKIRMAHCYVYEQLVAPIPDGHDLDHLCHNQDRDCPGGRMCPHRACVKAIADEHGPAHLEPVTPRENTRRSRARLTCCKRGHPFDKANTYIDPRGRRNCRACNRIAVDAYQAKGRR